MLLGALSLAAAHSVAAQCTAVASDLESWWTGDTDASDLQDGNDGTLQNGAKLVAGKVGNAFSFPGAGAFVNIPDAPNLNSTTATWDFWLQTTQSGAAVGVIGKHDASGSTHGFTFILQPNGTITAQIKDNNSGVATQLTSARAVNDGLFHHIALTLQSGGISRLFIDGTLETSQETLSFTFGQTPLRFGTMSDPFWTSLIGSLDEVQYYDRILSQAEIQSVFNAGSKGNCKQPVITGPTTATATVGKLFVYQFETTRATTLGVTKLPPPLTFDSNLAAIVGTPSSAGTFQVGLSATNSSATTNGTLTITVQPAPSSGPVITSSTSATGRTGTDFKFQVTTTGASPAARLSIKGLPPGLTFDPITGLISGIPTTDASAAVTLTITDGSLTTTGKLQLTFTSDATVPVIVSPSTAIIARGQRFTYTIRAPANALPADVTIYSLIGTLPTGLSFDKKSGVISGSFTGNAEHDLGPPDRDFLSGGVISNVQLFATNSHGTSTTPLVFFSAPVGAVNISTRLSVGTGDNVLIGGFILAGNAPKKLLLRAVGPSLQAGGKPVPGALQDTKLELYKGATLLGSNDDWRSNQEKEIIDTTVPPTDNRESAIVATLESKNTGYTAIVRGKNNTTGIGLAEIYDLGTASLDSSSTSRLANISTRGTVLTGNDVMIGGFIISGASTKVIARGIGPELTKQGVAGALQDTTLELRNGAGSLIIGNDDWRSTQQQQIIDTKVPPSDDRESAVVLTLPPGNYTAIVRGKDDSTGVALVEVYSLQ